ncbi:MAG: hypothetical protein OEX80_09905 [Candidatus Aminicenantes bacterium]|nr:hypothetical protein [Candidatus Aminicenantes bacterium]
MTNNKKEKERECLNPFLLYYNQINNSNYKEIATPDEDPNNPLNVDFLCEDQSIGKMIAIDILGFHHSENLARGDHLVRGNLEDIEKKLKGKVKGEYIASILYNVLNCPPGTCKKTKKNIVSAIINETRIMKLGKERAIKTCQITLTKLSDDGDTVGLLTNFIGSGQGAGLSELSKNIIEKNLKQFKRAKKDGYETFLLIDNQRELFRNHTIVSNFLKNTIDSIPPKEMSYIDHIAFITIKENKVSYIRE